MMKGGMVAWLKQNPIVVLYIFIVAYIALFSCISILKHYSFRSTAWDLGIYEQVLWSTVNTGKVFWYTPEIVTNPSCSFFGIHFAPILFLMLPIYAVFQYTETLLILQASVLALAAVPLYKLVFHETNSRKQALAFGLIYLAYPPVYCMTFFDFHVQAFLPLFFFSAFYFFRKEEWGKYLLFTVLSLMVIEFVPLIVAFLGLYGLWVAFRNKQSKLKTLGIVDFLKSKKVLIPALTVLLGVAWFIAARGVILAVNPNSPPHPNWKEFGDPAHDIPGFVVNVLSNPLKVLETIVTPVDQKAIYIFGLFAPLAFLSFLDLPSLLIGLPWFFVAFLSNYSIYYNPIGYQYVAFVAPFIFISAMYGAQRFMAIKRSAESTGRLRVFSRLTLNPRRKSLLTTFLVCLIAASYVSVLGVTAQVPSFTEHNRLLETFTRLVPADARILTQNDIFPHLSRRLYGYVGGGFTESLLSTLNIEYILVDTTSSWSEESFMDSVRNLTKNGDFGLQYAADGIWLLKKGYTGETIYPTSKGMLTRFYNQGVKVKLFDAPAFEGEPSYESVTLSILVDVHQNVPPSWRAKDSFAMLFEGWFYAPVSGNYTFHLESLGYARLLVDDATVFSINATISAAEEEVHLGIGLHSIEVGYVKYRDHFPPSVCLLWKPAWSDSLQEISSELLYHDLPLDVSSVFLQMAWDWPSRSPFLMINREHFGIFGECTLRVPVSGVYRFKVSTADQAFVFIDCSPVFSSLDNSTASEKEISLEAGNHKVQLCHVMSGDRAHIDVVWQRPGRSQFEDIPSDSLYWSEG